MPAAPHHGRDAAAALADPQGGAGTFPPTLQPLQDVHHHPPGNGEVNLTQQDALSLSVPPRATPALCGQCTEEGVETQQGASRADTPTRRSSRTPQHPPTASGLPTPLSQGRMLGSVVPLEIYCWRHLPCCQLPAASTLLRAPRAACWQLPLCPAQLDRRRNSSSSAADRQTGSETPPCPADGHCRLLPPTSVLPSVTGHGLGALCPPVPPWDVIPCPTTHRGGSDALYTGDRDTKRWTPP